jgi:thiol-disulfide isomerase/thioredoxin
MAAGTLGPLVLAYDRLVVFAGLALFLALCEWLARRRREPELAAAAWNASLAGLLAARLGYVASHWSVYSQDPLSALYVWQGCFSPAWGLAGGLVYALWSLRRRPLLLRRALLPALAGLALALGLWALPNRSATALTLPDARLYDLEGRPVNLADLGGGPLVLNVWATWCPPCRRELPMLAGAAAAHPQVTFVFVASGEPAGRVAGYLDERGLQLPHALVDPAGELARRLPVRGYPTTFFFDSQGKLVSSKTGELNRAGLEDQLARLR